MELPFVKKKKDKLVAIFDIGSGSVGGALARIPNDEKTLPVIIASTRTEIEFHNELDFNTFKSDMLEALRKTAEDLYNKKAGAPEEIICTLSSPWYLSEMRIVKMERNTPFIFTKKIADELLQKEVNILTENYKKKYTDAHSTPELIEHTIIKMSLNGYQVTDPIDKNTRNIEMNIIITLAPKDCIQSIKEILLKTFHHTPVTFSSFMTSAYLAIRDKYISEDSYLLVDINGEVTDIAIVSKDILHMSLSFPFGRQTFFRFLRKKLNKSIEEAHSLFSLYLSKTLEANEDIKFKPILSSIGESWTEAFRESIASLPRTIALPGTVFLIANPDVKDWFAEIVRCEEYIKSTMVEHKCKIVTLEGPEFLDTCKVTAGLCDPFLMIEAIAISRRKK